jgi:hypothetical protein
MDHRQRQLVHGTDGGYRRGCRCVKCKAAHAAKAREDRARNPVVRARQSGQAKVLAMPTHPQTVSAIAQVGPNEAAVREQAEASPKADSMPGTIAQARTLARILDNPEYSPLHAQVSRQIHALLLSLDTPKKKSRGRLYAVQQMTARR